MTTSYLLQRGNLVFRRVRCISKNMDKFTLKVFKLVEEWARAIFGEDMSNWEKHPQTKVLFRTDPNVLQHLNSFLAMLREEQARGSSRSDTVVPEDQLKQCATFLRIGRSCYNLGALGPCLRPTTLTLRTLDFASLLCVSISGTAPTCSDKNGENLHFIDDIECAVARLLPVISYGSPGCREVSISRIISSSFNTHSPGDMFPSD
ncbi:hypothetical protein BDY19DRAFT_393837 [Irpex rosettiformis]|uniref:Uncharacterized protein n=1 Tax=Irpex rosettiformis TaxID=378272 RepID=A0ACB8TUT9_9APHY|nr:hypothetical protein BDY19DRAFT_393837 [Irpex rosettiformis]